MIRRLVERARGAAWLIDAAFYATLALAAVLALVGAGLTLVEVGR